MKLKYPILFSVCIALVVIATMLALPSPRLQAQSDGAQRFRAIRIDNSLTVGGDTVMAGDLTVGGTQTFTGAATFASTLNTTGAANFVSTLKVGTIQKYQPQTAISVTNGITNLTPTGTYQPLTSSGTVTVTSLITSTAFVAGDVVKLINTNASGDIIFTDGTYLVMPGSANLTLGPTDALELWFNGTSWITVSTSNN